MAPKIDSLSFDGGPIHEVRFYGDAMLMFGWIADENLRIRCWNKSLGRWINDHRPSILCTAACAERLKQGVLDLKDFLRYLLDDEDERVGEIVQQCLQNIQDEWTSLVTALKGRKEERIVDSTVDGEYSLLRTVTLVEDGHMLAGVRVVKAAGIRMRSANEQDLVDLINVCMIDGDGNIRGFQGQLQEASTRVEGARKHATRAAVAAIMARNLSHNVGSHVLARLSTADAVKSAVFRDKFLKSILGTSSKQFIDDAAEKLSPLNEFLRARMDFIAEIATADRPPAPTRLLFLWDTLLPLTRQSLLLANLCASQGLGYEDFAFRVTLEHRTVEISEGEFVGKRDEEKLDEELGGISVGIPNGPVGVQAFWCIIENFIRNAVKHSTPPPAVKGILITIRVCQDEGWPSSDRLLKVIIHDNWRACRSRPSLVDDLNKRLQNRFTERDGSISAHDRGLKEMRAAAAYLRGSSPVEADSESSEPPFLKAVSVEESIGYELYAPRPKDLFVVDSRMERSKLGRLRKQGVEIVVETAPMLSRAPHYELLLLNRPTQEVLHSVQSNGSDFPARVIIVESEEAKAVLGTSEASLSTASLKDVLERISTALDEGNGTDAVACAWELWINILCQQRLPKLWIFDGKDNAWNIGDFCRSVTPNNKPDEGVPTLLYARHGRDHEAVLFYEPYEKFEPICSVLEYPPATDVCRRSQAYQLMEAALLPIIVLDERVQESAVSEKRRFELPEDEGERELGYWLKCMRVYVPLPRELNLGSQQLHASQVEGWFNELFQELPKDYPAFRPLLVVHQGILDVIGDTWLANLKNMVCEIIVTSGRGVPTKIPRNTRFVPLSTVSMYSIEAKSKFHLVRTLLSGRRPAGAE